MAETKELLDGKITGYSMTNGNVKKISSISTVQPKYGVVCPVPHMSEQYSPPSTSFTSGSGIDINITYSQLEENINMLKKSISTLKSSWDGETKRNIDTLNNSWVGQDCTAYTSKLMNMDSKVQNTISALELLCSTYEKARDMIRDNQSQVASSINNM